MEIGIEESDWNYWLELSSLLSGDTWVYGVPSDPIKISQYREIGLHSLSLSSFVSHLVRLRSECLETGQCDLKDYAIRNMSRFLIKVPEHTWGLPGVQSNDWSNPDFQKVLIVNGIRRLIQSVILCISFDVDSE